MITVTTYLRAADGTFRPVQAGTAAPADPNYIEGAIELTVDGTTVIGTAEWDYVDQLWAYVADMLHTLKTGDEATTYFPDQPIRLTFARTAGQILLTCDDGEVVRQARADEADLVAALQAAARQFFDTMSDLVRANAAGYQRVLATIRP
jgi:hypothetical protein